MEGTHTRIAALRHLDERIKDALDAAVTRLNVLTTHLPQDVLGSLAGDWASLSEDQQRELHERLLSIAATLEALIRPRNIFRTEQKFMPKKFGINAANAEFFRW